MTTKSKIILGSLGLVLFISGWVLGLKLSGPKYHLYGSKSFIEVGNELIEIGGELIALDFEPAMKPLIISMRCFKLQNEYKMCARTELGVLSDYGHMTTEVFYDDQFEVWDQRNNIRIRDEKSSFVRTIEISIENKSLVETFKYGSGEIRTLRLVDSFDRGGTH